MAVRTAVAMMARADHQLLKPYFSPLRVYIRSGILIDPPLNSHHGGRFSQAG